MTTPAHTVVLASAGTGKTFRLANRFIALLALGADPGSILATTFTRKAAGEILSRILSRLAAGASDPAALADLRRHTGIPLTQDRCLELITALVHNLHRVKVLTIDAFLARVITAFGPELGVGASNRLLDPDEDARIRSRAVEDALRAGDEAEMVNWLAGLTGGAAREVHSTVLREIGKAYNAWLAAGDNEPWSFFGPESAPLDADAIGAACRALAALRPPPTKAGTPDKNWEKSLAHSLATAHAADWSDFIAKGIPNCILCKQDTYSRHPIDDTALAAFTPLVEHARSLALSDFRDRNIASAALLSRFDTAYTRLKDSIGGFTFADVPRRLLAAGLEDRLSDLYYRLDAQIHHLLLDEVQDTSLGQFRLLEPIIDELVSRDGASFFSVGDAKQSLYTWRNAEPELLPSLSKRWPQITCEGLSESFRSSPAILSAVNQVFGSLKTNPATAAQPAAHAWADNYAQHTAHHTSRPGRVCLRVAPDPGAAPSADPPCHRPSGSADGRCDAESAILRAAANRAAEILADFPSATIGILVRRNKPVASLVYELSRLGIDAAGEGGNPLADSPPCAAAASLLHLVDHPGDTAALFHLATCPLGPCLGFTDPGDLPAARRLASTFRARIAREGCAPILASIQRDGATAMDRRALDRFTQLIDLARGFDQTPGRPADLARLIWSHPVDEPGRRQVSILTIHRAKGLEFDAVILPELAKKWAVHPKSILLARGHPDSPDPFAPVYAATCYPSEILRTLHPGLAAIYEHAHNRIVNEELCALYVAMTRAIHILDLIIPPGRLPDLSAASLLCHALAPGIEHIPDSSLWTTGELTRSDRSTMRRQPEPDAAPASPPEPLRITLAPTRSAPIAPPSSDPTDLAALWRSIAQPDPPSGIAAPD